MNKKIVQISSLSAFTAMFMAAILISISMPTDVQAQGFAEPTATPTSPIWLGYSLVRDAVEETENVDLDIVQRWDFFQDDWTQPNSAHPGNTTGIDNCDSTVNINQARRSFFGLTYQITDINGNFYEGRVSFDLEDVVLCDIVNAPTQVADSGDDEAPATGDLPAPIAGAGATGSFELGGHVDGLTSQAISAMNSAGMTWVKKQLPTSAGVQKGYEFIEDAQAQGFKILLGIIGDKAALAADPQGYADDYAVFVGAMAEAGADAIEVWNEPNIDREWPTGQVNGANYTALLATAYNGIKSRNPNTIVISGAPAPTGFFGAAGCGASGCNDDVFMQQMAQAGAARYMDCLGLHYNEGIVSPSTFSGDPRGEYPTYYFESMTNRGKQFFPNTPICYTELGYLSPEGMGGALPGGFAWAGDVSVAEHASWLGSAAARAAQRGDVRLLIVWNVNFTRFDSDPMGGYAIIRPDGNCPACNTLGQVMGG